MFCKLKNVQNKCTFCKAKMCKINVHFVRLKCTFCKSKNVWNECMFCKYKNVGNKCMFCKSKMYEINVCFVSIKIYKILGESNLLTLPCTE